MLIPVIGILQVGDQARADRYTYLPQIGIYLMIAWAVADLSANWPKRSVWLAALGTVVLTGLIFVSHSQAAYWRDSETLWSRSLACNNNNTTAEVLLAEAYHSQGKTGEAMRHLEKALVIEPRQFPVHSSLGVFYLELGQANKSLEHLQKALEIQPHFQRLDRPVCVARDMHLDRTRLARTNELHERHRGRFRTLTTGGGISKP
jgi:tetratricopeptide (TPR) repeat protein